MHYRLAAETNHKDALVTNNVAYVHSQTEIKKMPAMKHVSAFESCTRRTVMVELRHNIVLQVVFSTLATSYCTAWNSNQTLVCPRRFFYGLCRRFSAIYFVLQGNISRHVDVILTVVMMANDALPVNDVNDN